MQVKASKHLKNLTTNIPIYSQISSYTLIFPDREKASTHFPNILKLSHFLPSTSQFKPLKPRGHVHINASASFLQVPPLKQGVLAHVDPKLLATEIKAWS